MNANNKFYTQKREQQLKSIENDLVDLKQKISHLSHETEYNGCQNDDLVRVATDYTKVFVEKANGEMRDLNRTIAGLSKSIMESDRVIQKWHEEHK